MALKGTTVYIRDRARPGWVLPAVIVVYTGGDAGEARLLAFSPEGYVVRYTLAVGTYAGSGAAGLFYDFNGVGTIPELGQFVEFRTYDPYGPSVRHAAVIVRGPVEPLGRADLMAFLRNGKRALKRNRPYAAATEGHYIPAIESQGLGSLVDVVDPANRIRRPGIKVAVAEVDGGMAPFASIGVFDPDGYVLKGPYLPYDAAAPSSVIYYTHDRT